MFHSVLKSQGSNLSFWQRQLRNGYSGGPENVTIVGPPQNFNFGPNFITFGQLVCKLELFKSEGPGIQGLIQLTLPTLKCSYLGNRMSVGLQTSHGIQSTMAFLLRQILATRPKALSSSKASFSTPIAKAEYVKIPGLQRSKQKRFDLAMPTKYAYQLPSQPCQSPVASSSSLTSFSTPLDKAGCAKIHKMYLGN